MRIGIDARMYGQGLGIGRYIERLIAHLEDISLTDDVYIFLSSESMDAYTPRNIRFHKVSAPFHWYRLAEQFSFVALLYRHQLDIMHFPHFNVPLLYMRPFVVTIHDLILLKHPLSATSAASTRHPLIHGLKYWAFTLVLRSAASRARAICTISQGVKKDICELLSVPQDKVSVLYEGVNDLSQESVELPRAVQRPFILCVGNAYPHKNLDILLEVFSVLRERGIELSLVFCGQEDFFQKRLVARIAAAELSSVIHLGSVSDATLRKLYETATCLIFPSLEEGFGLPGLEAMHYGCPVLASNSSVLPEIYKDAALYFDPRAQDDILQAVVRVFSDENLRSNLIARGYEQIRHYSWQRMAEGVYALYAVKR